MTHKNILTKFVIEYDKNNATSSYPSLTEYEIATILDKAYLALIAQKVTGNNVRRSAFETDLKSISDIQPLITKAAIYFDHDLNTIISNQAGFALPSDFLYFVQGYLRRDESQTGQVADDSDYVKEEDVYTESQDDFNNIDNNDVLNMSEVYNDADDKTKTISSLPFKLVPHEIAEKFFVTPYNMPWVKIPVFYIENGNGYIVYDPVDIPMVSEEDKVYLTYIKRPLSFVDNMFGEGVNFECNDTIAEELISLAVAFALENVESQRLNTKLNTRGLEA